MLVIGDREMETQTVAPRFRDGKSLDAMSISDFVSLVQTEAAAYK
jgi:threonyl-tRNA synthetase